jgi:hypothetical protein
MCRRPLSVLCCVFLAQAGGWSQESRAPKPGSPPAPLPGDAAIGYWGTVTEVTKNTLTIRFNDREPKKFAVSDTLSAGEIPMHPRLGSPRGRYHVSATFMYRLKDIKVGDWVNIYYAQIGGSSICDHVSITKRPGGKVPPLPPEAEVLMIPKPIAGVPVNYVPYHEHMDAYWNLTDNGIPYPDRFGPERRFPAAPPPRPIKRSGS